MSDFVQYSTHISNKHNDKKERNIKVQGIKLEGRKTKRFATAPHMRRGEVVSSFGAVPCMSCSDKTMSTNQLQMMV